MFFPFPSSGLIIGLGTSNTNFYPGRRRWASHGVLSGCYWHSIWFFRGISSKDEYRRNCFTGFWMGGMLNKPLLIWAILWKSNNTIFTCCFFLCAWQWLGLDKELKRLVVETTANQVSSGFLNINSSLSFVVQPNWKQEYRRLQAKLRKCVSCVKKIQNHFWQKQYVLTTDRYGNIVIFKKVCQVPNRLGILMRIEV